MCPLPHLVAHICRSNGPGVPLLCFHREQDPSDGCGVAVGLELVHCDPLAGCLHPRQRAHWVLTTRPSPAFQTCCASSELRAVVHAASSAQEDFPHSLLDPQACGIPTRPLALSSLLTSVKPSPASPHGGSCRRPVAMSWLPWIGLVPRVNSRLLEGRLYLITM